MNGTDRREILTIAESLYRQAHDKMNAGEYRQARDILLQVIKIAPNLLHPLIEIGNCYACLNQSDKAILCYEKVIQIDPLHAGAWFNKGMTMKKKGNEKEAAVCIKRAIELYCCR